LELLATALSAPCVYQSSIFLVGKITQLELRPLARADCFRLVDSITEVHLEYNPNGTNIFTVSGDSDEDLGRVLASACLSLGQIPTIAVSSGNVRCRAIGEATLGRFSEWSGLGSACF
jgi:hypothetical protein